MGIVAAGIPKKPPRFDSRLDRPFLFILTGKGNLPLFTGIVHRPVEAKKNLERRSKVRKPFRYEYYLLSCISNHVAFTDQGYRMPKWLADEMRVYRQIYELCQLMDPYRNGYTISVNALKRFQKARDSLYASGEWISPQMARMVEGTIQKISELYSAVLDHYDTKRTVQIKDRSDRHMWYEVAKEILDILDEAPDIEWRSRREMESPSPVVLVKELWK